MISPLMFFPHLLLMLTNSNQSKQITTRISLLRPKGCKKMNKWQCYTHRSSHNHGQWNMTQTCTRKKMSERRTPLKTRNECEGVSFSKWGLLRFRDPCSFFLGGGVCPLFRWTPGGPWGMQSSRLYHPRRGKEPAMLLGWTDVAIGAVRSGKMRKSTLAAKIVWEEAFISWKGVSKIMPSLWARATIASQTHAPKAITTSKMQVKMGTLNTWTHRCQSHCKLWEGVLGWVEAPCRYSSAGANYSILGNIS